jgi:hypothetical protein
MLQWPRSPRSHPKNPRFSNSVSSRSGMAAQKSTEVRRRLHEVQTDQADLQRRQGEFEDQAAAAPSETWPEAAEKARYLIHLFAATPEARDPPAGKT